MDEIKRRAKSFLEIEKWTDCSFFVGNTKEIKAHKIILAAGSIVFEEMLFGSLAETKFPIKIPDTRPEYFSAILKYIYTNDLSYIIAEDTLFEKTCGLYYLADKYHLPSTVLEACANHLEKIVNFNNACSTYEFSNLYNIPAVRQKAVEVIKAQTKSVLLSSSFRESDFSTVMFILEQEKLEISSEMDLFNAVARYFLNRVDNSQEETDEDVSQKSLEITNGTDKEENNDHTILSKTREEMIKLSDEDTENLKEAIKMIRFLTMTAKEFAEGPAQSNILQQNDIHQIMFAISNPPTINRSYPKGFSTCNVKRECYGLPLVLNIPAVPANKTASSIFGQPFGKTAGACKS